MVVDLVKAAQKSLERRKKAFRTLFHQTELFDIVKSTNTRIL
jgi:hypothetical protein